MNYRPAESRRLFTRREALAGLTLGLFGAGLAACGGRTGKAPAAVEQGASADFSARFSRFEVAPEPNGDLTRVVWPDYVKRAGPEVQRLYEFQIENGDLMKYMPCFCGCGQDAGHRNNRDCYVKQVNSDGSVVFDSMAPT